MDSITYPSAFHRASCICYRLVYRFIHNKSFPVRMSSLTISSVFHRPLASCLSVCNVTPIIASHFAALDSDHKYINSNPYISGTRMATMLVWQKKIMFLIFFITMTSSATVYTLPVGCLRFVQRPVSSSLYKNH